MGRTAFGFALCALFVLSLANIRVNDEASIKTGVGIYDITGPASQIGMMGYAMISQTTAGLHQRLRSRAYVFGDTSSNERVVFVNTDSCMIFIGVKQAVIAQLQVLYGNLYRDENVMISGTHTHSGPAGYSFLAMYGIMSLGFYKDNFDTIVNGIVKSISAAHENFEKSKGSKVYIKQGELLESSVNRSPSSYLANPEEERNKYAYNVDKEMTVLRLEDLDGREVGMLSWFAVHGTSMNNTNYLVSGDNKGYASYLFEKFKNGNESVPGMGPFVAAFAQSNEGDVSPNTRGAFCPDGRSCDFDHSTCDGRTQGCIGKGPGENDFQSTKIIGDKQFRKALELFTEAKTPLKGPIRFVHTYVNMSNLVVNAKWTSTKRDEQTCIAALGHSFAAGTTDGPGEFDFKQGTNSSGNPFWNFISSFLSKPTPQQIKCQHPKPILLNTGDIHFPLQWTADLLPLQILRVGQLIIVGVPGEITTMSGRRLRDTVRQTLIENGAADNSTVIVIAGLTNAYSHYITTYEEYQYQRYEGASTLYGPHTLAGHQQEYSKLAAALAKGTPVPPGPTPPDLSGKTFSFQPPVIFDAGPFGRVYQDVLPRYERGETATVTFYGANLRNNFRTQNSFLTVERLINSQWTVILRDSDWDTKFHWRSYLIAESLVTVEWEIDPSTTPGTYRIRTFGTSKSVLGEFSDFIGTSSTFEVQ